MKQLTITLPEDLEEKVRQYAKTNHYDSISDFIRESLSEKISGKISYFERCLLVEVLEIRKNMGLETSEELLSSLKNGYQNVYNSLLESRVANHEMLDTDQEFVYKVLDMYSDLQISYERSNNKNEEIKKNLSFPGFDGNSDDGFNHFVNFLAQNGRYKYVKPLDGGFSPNSHSSSSVGMYERMLNEYSKIKKEQKDGEVLTLDEIDKVLKAQIINRKR